MIDAQTTEISITRMLWSALGGEEPALASLRFSGPAGGLPSRFRVGELAVAAIAVATVAAAELWARRRDKPLARVVVDRRLTAAAFRSEALLQSVGWQRPAMWDAIAGDYPAADGWIRLHTNYSYHRDAVARVLGVPAQRERVAEAVRSRRASELETEVVDAGGCAAALRSVDAWREHPQGRALASEPLCEWRGEGARAVLSADEDAPLAGVRVLDLTRVIAGPIATRYLAGFGAQVLRIDPPGFDEVAGLLPLTTQGKRCAALDLRKDR